MSELNSVIELSSDDEDDLDLTVYDKTHTNSDLNVSNENKEVKTDVVPAETIIIIDDEEENTKNSSSAILRNSEDSNYKSDHKIETCLTDTNHSPTPSTSTAINSVNNEFSSKVNTKEVLEKLEFLIDSCYKMSMEEKYKEKFDKLSINIKKLYFTVVADKKPLKSFDKFLSEKCNVLKSDPSKAIMFFSDVFLELKQLKNTNKVLDKRLLKLTKALKKCNRKIKQLENQEVDFDDEENSAYLQLERYMKRAADIHAYICKLNKQNPYFLSLLHRRLDFSKSKYVAINQAINKKFKNCLYFPDYVDIYKCIKNCVEQNNMNLCEKEMKTESSLCFKELGNILQNRRKRELLIDHSIWFSDEDPADNDPKLSKILEESSKKFKMDMDAKCKEFSDLQEKGFNANLSEDSSQSDYEVSDLDS